MARRILVVGLLQEDEGGGFAFAVATGTRLLATLDIITVLLLISDKDDDKAEDNKNITSTKFHDSFKKPKKRSLVSTFTDDDASLFVSTTTGQ